MDEQDFISLLGVDWKREGTLYKICCPFHHDTHPSLVVYPQDRGYCCFPCGRTGSWQELYKEMKGCEWKEAYDVLGIEGDYSEATPHIRFEFVDPEKPEVIKAVQERYEKCISLDDERAKPGAEFLEKKKLLEVAKELGWRWDTGVFLQSRPNGALVIPYYEDGELVHCRLRPFTDHIEKPKTLKGVNARPYVLRADTDTLYICEGESDALALYASGCSVVAVPGATGKRCLNTAVLYGELWGVKRIISCGDNDPAGEAMNEWVKKAAAALTAIPVETLDYASMGGLNDINDAFVAGKLDLNPIHGTPLEGWDAVFAKALFSERDEIISMVIDEIGKGEAPKEETDFLASMVANNMNELKEAWAGAPRYLQEKYIQLKDIMKMALEEKPLNQEALFDIKNRG